MLTLDYHDDSARHQVQVDRVVDLLGELLLNLESPAERVHDSWQLGETNNLCVWEVTDVAVAHEGDEMMFTL